MTRLLVFEYLHAAPAMFRCAGTTMRSEGRAMLEALLEDARCLSDSDVSCLLCEEAAQRLSAEVTAGVSMKFCRDGDDVLAQLCQAAGAADIVVPVAPETDELLLRVAEVLEETNAKVLLPPTSVIRYCSDKLRTWEKFSAAGVAVVPTAPMTDAPPGADDVVKHRLGAGCEGIFRGKMPTDGRPEDYILQPWIGGCPLSVGVLANAEGNCVLPPTEQRIRWDNGTPRYRGGIIPADVSESMLTQARRIADRVLIQVGSFSGYLGIDLIATTDGIVLLNEINPRLCTSYIGYRRLLPINPLDVMLGTLRAGDVQTDEGSVEFTADGMIL